MTNKIKSKRNNSERKDYWGYLVCCGTIITFIAGIGHVNSFGLIYNDYIKETNATAKSLTSAHGVFAIMLALGGLILNLISKKRSLRLGGLIGSVLFIIGSFATIGISSMSQLSITFGVLQGTGFGMMVPVCYSTLNYYFVKKRTTVMSICKGVQGLFLIIYPQILKKSLMVYGFRSTLLVLSGMSLHTIAGMLVMTPRIANKKISKDVEKLIQDDKEIIEKEKSCNSEMKNEGRFQILRILNLKILEDPIFCNICLGMSFVNFSDLSFFILQPMLLFQYGYDKNEVAACISICSAADVFGRFCLAAISNTFNINTRVLFYFSTLATLFGRITLLLTRNFTWVASTTAVLGLLRAWIHVTSPLVISNHVTHEDFPAAYAVSTLSAGVVNVIFSPVLGVIKDTFKDFIPAFYALAACCVPCLVLWPIEMFKRNRIPVTT